MSVNSSGEIVIAGSTSATDLPTTIGAYSRQCNCESVGFIAKFAPGGSKLLWATLLPPAQGADPSVPIFSTVAIAAMAVAADGSVIVGGTIDGDVPEIPGALQPVAPNPNANHGSGILSRIDSLGQRLLFSTYFGGGFAKGVSGIHALGLDSQAIWIAGGSPPSILPPSAVTTPSGPTYVAGISMDGSAVISALNAPAEATGQAIAVTQHGVFSLGTSGSLLIGNSATAPSLLGVANSTGSRVSGSVAPLQLVSFYGVGLGPATPLNAQTETQQLASVVTSSLGGVQVLFDGVASPLLFVGPNQINAIVPLEVSQHDRTTVQIVTPTGTVAGPALRVVPSQPQVFSNGTTPGGAYKAAAALNQDSTVNSLTNPAKFGSIVTVWATGAGLFNQNFIDGTILNAGGPLPPYAFNQVAIRYPVSVVTSEATTTGLNGIQSVRVLYAGAAPNAVQGVIQINFMLTDQYQYQLQIGSALSEPFFIYAPGISFGSP
jgi:uncharacterized protein (TIGR03437 family)